MQHTKDFYHVLLAWALVYIRAAETPEELQQARKIADMLHNVPEALCLPWTEERDEEIYVQIREKAQIHGLEKMLAGWERVVWRHLEQQVPA